MTIPEPAEGAVVAVRALHKTYYLYERPTDRLVEALTGRVRHRAHCALTDVSFEVSRGEAFGIIGENGAGKSTLLQVLAGVSVATSGSAAVHGRAASILELGGGFHPEMTGRQNLVMSAAMLGLSAREVRDCRDAIVEFAELGAAIDEPVRTYSTGMAMRLAFAIAVAIEPDVLIVDEALSVGDGYFQHKCLQRIRRFLGRGGTLLLASHAMYYVSELCQRALWLRDGRVEAIGPAAAVIRNYEAFLVARNSVTQAELPESEPGPVRIREVRSSGPASSGDAWSLEMECETDDPSLALHLAVGIDRVDGVQLCACSTRHDGLAPLTGQARYLVRLSLPHLPILQGAFTVYVSILDDAALHVHDRRVLPALLDVRPPDYRVGLIEVEHRWTIDQNKSLSPQE